MTASPRIRMNRVWWRERVARDGGVVFIAHVPIPIKPGGPRSDKVEHLFSAMIEPGLRHFAFATEAERDAFVTEFGATACPDPVT